MKASHAVEHFHREQVTLIQFLAERGYRIDLIRRVERSNLPAASRVSRAHQANDYDIAPQGNPLALNPEKAPLDVEYQVVPRVLG
jgi:hypothetical protein